MKARRKREWGGCIFVAVLFLALPVAWMVGLENDGDWSYLSFLFYFLGLSFFLVVMFLIAWAISKRRTRPGASDDDDA